MRISERSRILQEIVMLYIPELFSNDDHHKLMSHRRQEKCYKHRHRTRSLVVRYCGSIDMPQKERMNGFVPFTSELVPGS